MPVTDTFYYPGVVIPYQGIDVLVGPIARFDGMDAQRARLGALERDSVEQLGCANFCECFAGQPVVWKVRRMNMRHNSVVHFWR